MPIRFAPKTPRAVARDPAAARIIVICDNVRYSKSNLVAAYLQTSRIEMVALPPYCPICLSG